MSDLHRLRKVILSAAITIVALAVAFTAIYSYYPLKYTDLINDASERYGLEPTLVYAVIHAESKFNVNAHSRKGARGLMQVVKSSAEWAANEIGIANYSYERLSEPRVNIEIGCWLLSRLIKQFGNIETALCAYNAGSGNVSKWLDDPKYSSDGKTLTLVPFRETRDFRSRVLFNMKIYSHLLKWLG